MLRLHCARVCVFVFHVRCAGVGKSGVVGQRLAASLRSIGVRAHYIHAVEWCHGDLGVLNTDHDSVMLLSHSGNTPELVHLMGHLQARDVNTVSIVGGSLNAKATAASKLALASDSHIKSVCEADLLGLIPTRSIVAQVCLCVVPVRC